MKVTVLKTFKNKETGVTQKPGEVIEVTQKRYDEITKKDPHLIEVYDEPETVAEEPQEAAESEEAAEAVESSEETETAAEAATEAEAKEEAAEETDAEVEEVVEEETYKITIIKSETVDGKAKTTRKVFSAVPESGYTALIELAKQVNLG